MLTLMPTIWVVAKIITGLFAAAGLRAETLIWLEPIGLQDGQCIFPLQYDSVAVYDRDGSALLKLLVLKIGSMLTSAT